MVPLIPAGCVQGHSDMKYKLAAISRTEESSYDKSPKPDDIAMA